MTNDLEQQVLDKLMQGLLDDSLSTDQVNKLATGLAAADSMAERNLKKLEGNLKKLEADIKASVHLQQLSDTGMAINRDWAEKQGPLPFDHTVPRTLPFPGMVRTIVYQNEQLQQAPEPAKIESKSPPEFEAQEPTT